MAEGRAEPADGRWFNRVVRHLFSLSRLPGALSRSLLPSFCAAPFTPHLLITPRFETLLPSTSIWRTANTASATLPPRTRCGSTSATATSTSARCATTTSVISRIEVSIVKIHTSIAGSATNGWPTRSVCTSTTCLIIGSGIAPNAAVLSWARASIIL